MFIFRLLPALSLCLFVGFKPRSTADSGTHARRDALKTHHAQGDHLILEHDHITRMQETRLPGRDLQQYILRPTSIPFPPNALYDRDIAMAGKILCFDPRLSEAKT